MTIDAQTFSSFLERQQQSFLHAMAAFEPKAKWQQSPWTYQDNKGGGNTCIMEDGEQIERAAANFSHIHGDKLPGAALKKKQASTDSPFEAMGLSIIVHPINPMVPTSHANVRLIQTTDQQGKPYWWFGGGFDLTPFYPFKEDCIFWHQQAKKVCDTLSPDAYADYKAWCDRYFYLPHREEARGIGGIFFDELNEPSFEACMNFSQKVIQAYQSAYSTLFEKRMHQPYSDKQRAFQLLRRGRYVEFNLLYDRGTHFGLQSKGRTEAILGSMPPNVTWQYNYQPDPQKDPEEYALLHDFLPAQDWLA